MESDKPDSNLENTQIEQNDLPVQKYDDEEEQQKIEDIKQDDLKNREREMQKLMNRLDEKTEIDQWVIDLFNQLKKERNREEYLQKFVEDSIKNSGATYNLEQIRKLVSKYSSQSIRESLDFYDSVVLFDSAIQSLKGDIEKHIQRNPQKEALKIQREIPLDKPHKIGRIILSYALGKNFNLIGISGGTGVYGVPGENVVYKLDTSKLEKALEEGNVYCDSSKSNDKENALFQKMEGYFPEGSVLVPRNHEMTIEIGSELIDDLEVQNTNLPKNFTFLYTTTPLASEINNGGVGFNLNFGGGHMDKLMGSDFTKRFNGEGITQEELNMYCDKKFDEVINNIKKLSNNDKKIKELLEGLIKFSEDNDVVLDIYGTDNFTFYLDSTGNLKYHIIDPFMPGNLSKSRLHTHNDGDRITMNNSIARSYEYIMEKIKKYCE